MCSIQSLAYIMYQPTPVFLPGESQGWGSWWAAVSGVAQSRTQLSDLAAAATRSEEAGTNFNLCSNWGRSTGLKVSPNHVLLCSLLIGLDIGMGHDFGQLDKKINLLMGISEKFFMLIKKQRNRHNEETTSFFSV